MEFVLSVDVVCSTNHQSFLHADSLKTHKQTWRCMQTAYKFNVEQTKPRRTNLTYSLEYVLSVDLVCSTNH